MTDRERTITKLKILRTWCVVNPDHGKGLCVEDCRSAVEWLDDVLALLKEQQPRVMTMEEVEDALDTVVWVDRPGMENTSEAYARISAYSRVNKEIMLRYGFIEKPKTKIEAYVDYGITYRCWTTRPDEKVRAETAWQSDT